jgi:hypothetical protein
MERNREDDSYHRFPQEMRGVPNERSALDARTALCFHFGDYWPGASESER